MGLNAGIAWFMKTPKSAGSINPLVKWTQHNLHFSCGFYCLDVSKE
jgi:hypothetical protein